MQDCIFCKIANGEIPSHKVWEDDDFVAFLDIRPLEKGMTLVVPKKHLPSYIVDVESEELTKMLEAMKTVAQLLDEKLDGILRTTFLFEGLDVEHLHAKLIPFYKDKLESFHLPEEANHEELADIAQTLRS